MLSRLSRVLPFAPAAPARLTLARCSHTATPTKSITFIEKAKVMGANALLGTFTHREGFDRCLKNLEVTHVEDGKVTATMPVDDSVTNFYGTLHGGATSTIVDVVGTMALLTLDATRPGVSVDLNVSFASAAKKGSTLHIEGRVLKTGNTLGFTQVDILADGKLIATGRHTKAFASPKL
eukprot:m.246978 g.246978  ORF g.246978 m.246978 type:complete len:179 (+) comp15251_c0_seq1:1-537(+)